MCRILDNGAGLASNHSMRDTQLGASTLTVLGAILMLLGLAAILAAPEVMNYSEVNTLRGVGGGGAALGLILLIVGLSKKK